MNTPPLKPLIIASLPVFASVFIAATLVWHFNTPKLAMPFVLGIIAGGLVDLDNRLTGRLINIVITVALFTLSSLLAQSTIGTGVPFILAMTLMTFGFTILGTVGLKYRTIAFGALAVATYTTAPLPQLPAHIKTQWQAGAWDAVVVTAGSSAQALLQLLGPPPEKTAVVSIGKSTTARCRELGLRVDATAATPRAEHITQAIINLFKAKDFS